MPTLRDLKYSVVIDEPKTAPVRLFTPRNSWSYSSEMTHAATPHAYRIGYSGDKSGIDPDAIPYLKLKGRGYCRWYKGLAATTSGVAAGDDPGDGSAYALLARGTDDGA